MKSNLRVRDAIVLAVPAVLAAMPAHAYVGPGAGLGAIAVFFGVIASVLMAFFAILWYPIKRMLKKRKSARPEEIEGTDQS